MERFPTDLAQLRDVPSKCSGGAICCLEWKAHELVCWNVSWSTRVSLKLFHRWNGNRLTRVSHGKLHRRAGCQNWIEKGSFFMQRSRDCDFLRVKKPFLLMERDGTFSIWKTTNCNHSRAGDDRVTRWCRFSKPTGVGLGKDASNDGTFASLTLG